MRTDDLRVALLTYSTKPRGGVVHTLALAEALAARGAAVTVWTLGRGGDTGFFRPVDPAVAVRVVPLPERDGETVGERVLRSIATLGDAVDPAAFDVLHAQDCISANAVTRAGGRCVRTVHHLDDFTTPQLAACHERALREPFAHVCVSAAVAAELAARGIGATVIPNGVHARRFAEAVPAVRDRPYVLTVGGIEPRKGSLTLLDAWARLATPGVDLVVAGGETVFDHRGYRAAWDARAVELGVAPTVLGPVADDALPPLVAGAAAFAFPSVKEGFGIAAMEALAAGVPLVVSDLPVFRATFAGAAAFADGPDALAAALDDAIDRPDPARRAAGQALAASHTWDAAAVAHLAFYRTL